MTTLDEYRDKFSAFHETLHSGEIAHETESLEALLTALNISFDKPDDTVAPPPTPTNTPVTPVEPAPSPPVQSTPAPSPDAIVPPFPDAAPPSAVDITPPAVGPTAPVDTTLPVDTTPPSTPTSVEVPVETAQNINDTLTKLDELLSLFRTQLK